MPSKQELKEALYGKNDVYKDFNHTQYPFILNCAGVDNSYHLNNIIRELQPKIIIEVGTYTGWSAISMAKTLKSLNLTDTYIICVDTWLGGIESARDRKGDSSPSLSYVNGYPTLYHKFLANVVYSGVQDYILPIASPSNISAKLLKQVFEELNTKADMAYIDGSHDALDVYYDCLNYYDLIKDGGYLVGDDWTHETVREGVYTFTDQSDEFKMKVDVLDGGISWKLQKRNYNG